MSWFNRLFGGESKPSPLPSAPASGGAMTMRLGRPTPTDGAFDAWTSADLPRMLAALNTPTQPLDRHFLLMAIVAETYKQRETPDMATTCVRVGRMHLSEFPQLAVALRKEFADRLNGRLPRVTTCQHLATLLAERGEHAEAVRVCEQAMSFGLDDGTKGGFQKRIERIKKAATETGR